VLAVVILVAIVVAVRGDLGFGRHVPTRATPPVASPPPPSQYMAVPAAPAHAVPTPQAVPGTAPPLDADFAQLQTQLHAVIGMAFAAVGGGQEPHLLGEGQPGPAWSTIKVPLTMAALRAQDSPQTTAAMTAAITESDNAAAESIWEGLGDPDTAATKVEAVLKGYGDQTRVESVKVRKEFTAFGQTMWPLGNQVRFIAGAVCDSQNEPIFSLMGHVAADQSWGIGTIPGTEFKGGWGPSQSGQYLVRQIGVLTTATGKVAVALAAQPDSGSFADGTKDLTTMAMMLERHLGELPAGQCAH
jgi:hypothetical protein